MNEDNGEGVSASQPSNATQQVVTVTQATSSSHSVAIVGLVLGGLSVLVCWIPFVNLLFVPISGLGCVLSISGILISFTKRGSGILLGIFGLLLNGGAFIFMIFVNTAIIASIGASQ